MEKRPSNISVRSKRVLTVVALLLIVAALVGVAIVIAPTLISLVSDPARFRAWVDDNFVLSRLAMIGMVIIKVIIPVIPGKPFEIGAGYAFGAGEGAALCLIGATVGSYLVFFLVRKFGVRALNVFYPREKLLSMKFLQDTKRLSVWVFFIMLIPGTPKDFFSYFVGLTDIKFRAWALISPLARIPVIIMSTIGGDALGTQNFGLAAIVFIITLIVSATGILIYNKVSKSKENPSGHQGAMK